MAVLASVYIYREFVPLVVSLISMRIYYSITFLAIFLLFFFLERDSVKLHI